MWRISIIKRRASFLPLSPCHVRVVASRCIADLEALKEDNEESALKAFRTIVDEQPEKGEW